ncbi:undecaprenyl-diphosphate phosphatase [Nitrospirillum iridis]|uniref:Undecaprenyl-diphosphatase n=1 Tax=Nitrospirillum iridis TaxID=765888 RepID=A0A7X0B162_9PROT|nr:undecaprenyl-diphosphate phosphatase [Nitrospirillum iridis]MBB6252471.1 undecaprenyl-diphosphatase [Nitrospirillum iridis]
MSFLQTLIFAIIQGITELFPISSVAHGVLTPFLLGWGLDQAFLKEHFLPYLVMLHLGTAAALLVFFWRDWVNLLVGVVKRGEDRRVLFLLVVGTIPAALLGLAFEKVLRAAFSDPFNAAIFLMINGLLLFFGERLRGRGDRTLAQLGFGQAFLIGLAQSLALIPGFSRSGASMVAGFWVGLKHEEAARFSMLLATPIIIGASLLVVPKMLRQADGDVIQSAVAGGVVAGICAFGAVWTLMRWFKRHEVNAMRPFAFYCWALGIVVLGMIYL